MAVLPPESSTFLHVVPQDQCISKRKFQTGNERALRQPLGRYMDSSSTELEGGSAEGLGSKSYGTAGHGEAENKFWM